MRSAPILAISALALLAACDQAPGRDASRTATAPPAQAAPPPPSALFFVGRWAARPDLCETGAWVIQVDRLSTAGEVSCRFHGLEKTSAGFDVPAACQAQAPPQEHRLRFARLPSAPGLQVAGGPFADMALVRCPGGAYPPAEPAAPGTPGGLPDDRTPLAEGPIDPRSAQGAGQVIQTYFAHLSQREYRSALEFWRDHGLELDAFARGFAGYDSLAAQVGAPGRIERSAGTLTVRIPVQLYGRLKDGTPVNRLGEATLRRADDTPGPTPAERAWRIEAIAFRPAGS